VFLLHFRFAHYFLNSTQILIFWQLCETHIRHLLLGIRNINTPPVVSFAKQLRHLSFSGWQITTKKKKERNEGKTTQHKLCIDTIGIKFNKHPLKNPGQVQHCGKSKLNWKWCHKYWICNSLGHSVLVETPTLDNPSVAAAADQLTTPWKHP